MRDVVALCMELGKYRISMLVTITAAAGYLMRSGTFDLGLLAVAVGTFILALGASALNQVQEWRLDARMERTKLRPIPSGRISPLYGAALSGIMVTLGCLALAATGEMLTVYVGVFTLAWYNLLYTYLKRFSRFAIIPGSLVGSLPPIIGWTGAGGSLTDGPIVAVAAFLFVWQVPHFWILLMKFGDQYGDAGMPTLTSRLSNEQLGRITLSWMVATVAICLTMPWFGAGQALMIFLGMLSGGMWLLSAGIRLMQTPNDAAAISSAFGRINVFALLVVGLLALEQILYQTNT